MLCFTAGSSLQIQACFTQIIDTITSDHDFAVQAAALRSDTRLQHSLVQLLISSLHGAAVTVQLPPERWPAKFDWLYMGNIAKLLGTEPLRPSFLEQLEQPGSDSSTSAQRVLHSAAQLFAAAPASCPDGMTAVTFGKVWISLFSLLGAASSAIHETIERQQRQQGQAPRPAAQQQRMLAQLLLVLQQLPAAMRAVHDAVAADGGEEAGEQGLLEFLVEAMGDQCAFVLDLFNLLAFPDADHQTASSAASTNAESVLGSLAEVPAWCAAGSGLLRSLPHVAALLGPEEELVDSDSAYADSEEDHPLLGVYRRLVCTADKMAGEISEYSISMDDGGPWSAAHCAAASEALWQLHTALCRCIQSHAAGGLPMSGEKVASLLKALEDSLYAAVFINEGVGCGADQANSSNSGDVSSAAKARQAASNCMLPAAERVVVPCMLLNAVTAACNFLLALHRMPLRMS
jgi:hypothetical protein